MDKSDKHSSAEYRHTSDYANDRLSNDATGTSVKITKQIQ